MANELENGKPKDPETFFPQMLQLIKNEADPLARSKENGPQPLHLVMDYGTAEQVKSFLEVIKGQNKLEEALRAKRGGCTPFFGAIVDKKADAANAMVEFLKKDPALLVEVCDQKGLLDQTALSMCYPGTDGCISQEFYDGLKAAYDKAKTRLPRPASAPAPAPKPAAAPAPAPTAAAGFSPEKTAELKTLVASDPENFTQMLQLIKDGANPEALKGSDSRTPLHSADVKALIGVAKEKGQIDALIKAMNVKGREYTAVDIYSRNAEVMAALFAAAETREQFNVLLTAMNVPGDGGFTPLYYEGSNAGNLKLLLEAVKDDAEKLNAFMAAMNVKVGNSSVSLSPLARLFQNVNYDIKYKNVSSGIRDLKTFLDANSANKALDPIRNGLDLTNVK
jgi:hypothetical protein